MAPPQAVLQDHEVPTPIWAWGGPSVVREEGGKAYSRVTALLGS